MRTVSYQNRALKVSSTFRILGITDDRTSNGWFPHPVRDQLIDEFRFQIRPSWPALANGAALGRSDCGRHPPCPCPCLS